MGAGASSKKLEDPPSSPEVIQMRTVIESLRAENAKLKQESSHWQSQLQEMRVEQDRLETNLKGVQNKNRAILEQASFNGSIPMSPIGKAGVGSIKVCDRFKIWLTSMDLNDVLAEMTLEETHVDKSKALPALGRLKTALEETRGVYGVNRPDATGS